MSSVTKPFYLGCLIGLILALLPLKTSFGQEYVVYGVYGTLDLGGTAEKPRKDYYVSIGSSNGARVGSTLEVFRRIPTHDLGAQKLYKEAVVPIATLKVIHAEGHIAIARLEKLNPPERTVVVTPFSVMVGDLVQLK